MEQSHDRGLGYCHTVLLSFCGGAALVYARIDRHDQLPRRYTHEGLPRGPKWDEVQQLVASTSGDTPTDIRDHAMLLLLTAYGFRSGEVRYLRLDDIDWEQETIRVFRSKQRRTQYYPLIPAVGNAILRYIREVRPRTRYREIFFCSRWARS